METLDFGQIMNNNEYWFEEYDLRCPFCDDGDITVYKATCQNEDYDEEYDDPEEKGCGHKWEVRGIYSEIEEPDECPECGNVFIDVEQDQEDCEQCAGGYADVIYNTAYGVNVIEMDEEEAKKFAWEQGFALIENGRNYLVMLSCGCDMTWRIHYCRWKMQGYLDQEDIRDCMRSGGYVVLTDDERNEMLDYFKEKLTSPEQYAKMYNLEMKTIEKLRKEAS